MVERIPTKASIELDAGTETFASGLLLELIAALRRSRPAWPSSASASHLGRSWSRTRDADSACSLPPV
jgi:hypothetical protein